MTQAEYKKILKQKMDLFKLILKKTGATQEEVLLPIIQKFINENMDVLTKAERQKFDKLILK